MSTNDDKKNMGKITIGGNVVGSNINIGGNNVNQNVRNVSGEITQNMFYPIVTQAKKIKSSSLREDVLEILRKLEAEAGKGDQADEKRVQNWMSFLADIAPDVWEVAVRTFLNPIDGISLVFRKVAARAKN